VVIELKRRLGRENIKPFRFDRADHLDVLARKAARWAADNAGRVSAMDPVMPPGIINRQADNWRPLVMIAAAVGGRWPARVSKAALQGREAGDDDEGSRLELLLGDIRGIFAGASEMPSADLVDTLVAIESRPWAEMGKDRKPMTQNRLARMLKPLKIAPEKVGPRGARVSGYILTHFKEAFDRYLGSVGDSQPDTMR
jgi:hypothetical protein